MPRIASFLLNLIFPPLCFGCGKRGSFLCEKCRSKIELHASAFCPVCGNRLTEKSKICHPSSYVLAAAGKYDNPLLQKLIFDLKYRKIKAAACPLADILAKYLLSIRLNLDNSFLIPVPLHRQRQRERGFNQSLLIARRLSERLNLRIIPDCVARIRNTPSQTGLDSKKKRNENIAGCFAVRRPDLVYGKKIILLDDVFTTGATMNELFRLLKQNMAGRAVGATIAKT